MSEKKGFYGVKQPGRVYMDKELSIQEHGVIWKHRLRNYIEGVYNVIRECEDQLRADDVSHEGANRIVHDLPYKIKVVSIPIFPPKEGYGIPNIWNDDYEGGAYYPHGDFSEDKDEKKS